MSVRFDGAVGDTCTGTEAREAIVGRCPGGPPGRYVIGQGKVRNRLAVTPLRPRVDPLTLLVTKSLSLHVT